MLIHWQSHQEYLNFLHETKIHPDSSQRTRLRLEFGPVREKLCLLDLDPVMEYLSAFYSPVGRPAKNQVQIIRSLILMVMLGFTSLAAWLRKLKADSLPAVLIGCDPDSLLPPGSYFDLMNRLRAQSRESRRSGRKDLFPKHKNGKPSKKPGRGKKLPNRHSGITDRLAAYALKHEDFPFHYEERLQHLFRFAAILPSLTDGLIPADGLTLSGDGTCVHSHASPYGHKVCNCMENGISHCSCKRHFSDPDAHWGWDSDEEVFYFDHTLYMLCSHNARYGVDLPPHIRFLDARRNDSVSAIVSLREFRTLNPDIPVRDICLDVAHDNYATYGLCRKWMIRPFIDLNSNRGRPDSIPDSISIDKDGTPLCMAGFRMVNWGYCRQKHSRKWRCPPVCGRVDSCPCKEKCSSSPYGRCVYAKPDRDIRLYTPVPRGTGEYKEIYSNRTSCKRVNNRVLNDYHLHDMGIHTRKWYSFFTMIICICIHLDARLKKRTKQEP